jgi:hypothetical protein
MVKKTFLAIVGTLISLGALYAWTYTAPAEGSGWILFLAFVGALGLVDSLTSPVLGSISATIIATAAGAAWWLYRPMPHSGWVLGLCILCGLRLFSLLGQGVSGKSLLNVSKSKTKVSNGGKTTGSIKIKF